MYFIILAILLLIVIALAGLLYVVVFEASPIVEKPLRDEQDKAFFSTFSNSYFEARKKFREAAKSANAKLSTHLVCMDPQTGLELTIDIAVLNAPPTNTTTTGGNNNNTNNNNKRNDTIVHMCGTHGIEGYCGSAIQIRALENMSKNPEGNKRYDSSSPTIIFIHAVNPFGMANMRRFNESNVDLNRNCFGSEQEWAAVKARGANQFAYENFRSLLNPPCPQRFWDRIQLFPKIAFYLATVGFDKLKTTFVTGQYHHPEGLYYGGQRLEKSWNIIREAITPYIGGKKPSSSSSSSESNIIAPTRRLIVIDVHSGLGPSGVDTIMCRDKKQAVQASDVFHRGCLIDDPSAAGGASAGYLDAIGNTDLEALAWNEIATATSMSPSAVANEPTLLENFKKQKKHYDFYLGITEEFGTIPGIFVARGVLFENAGYQHARGSPGHRMAQEMSRAAFYVESWAWKESVLRRGLERLDQAVEYFKNQE